ncbi:hypothetical protein Shyhy01_42000 [Streptomyces hygroscopicus subsp. hygroscopicus]|uniref:hypothetical protein n=1 Tax=Streptomyces sp. KHY 26 TaxID=3097359 RepID=UPI0024A5F4DC|nr:hypothetical protein [Streptomyces hygroscopicus]GLX51250.1 hypothetical protein Shyhy01_42000 [Streptomyces hygroscopicus subsp. hygroscopicus]
MRIRATVAAVSGALAISALAVPAAQAVTDSGTPYTLNASFSNVSIAKAIKVGTTNEVSVSYSYTLTHGSTVNIAASDFYTDAFLYHGTYSDTAPELYGDNPATCTATSSTTATCKGSINIYPTDADPKAADAGTWNVAAEAVAFNGQDQQNPDMSKVGYKDQSGLGTTLVQRYSKLTTTVSSTSVYKGKTFTASGKLSRANWDDNLYHGYTNQPVKLQFRKAGTTTYTTVKTVYTDSYGNLKTTATANYSGYWRYSFAGTSTTPAVSATGVYVGVK